MHIFLVNDDGIQSTGINALCRAAVERGHQVSVCAPSRQQSAASHRITLTDPIYVQEHDMGLSSVNAWAITGTPTDCVRLGLFELVRTPVDVLISGINDGYNAGMAVHYSGTVGAATEGALNRVRAMAVSVHHKATGALYDYVAKLAIVTAEQYAALKTPPATILNMNAPLRDPDASAPPDARAAFHRQLSGYLHPPGKPPQRCVLLDEQRMPYRAARGGQRFGFAQQRARDLHLYGQTPASTAKTIPPSSAICPICASAQPNKSPRTVRSPLITACAAARWRHMDTQEIIKRLNLRGKPLSKGHRRIAAYIAEHSEKAAFMTAVTLGQNCGVSESTVVRFATAMGYEGYPELQSALQELVRQRLTASQRFNIASEIKENDVLRTVLKNDMRNIRLTTEELTQKGF